MSKPQNRTSSLLVIVFTHCRRASRSDIFVAEAEEIWIAIAISNVSRYNGMLMRLCAAAHPEFNERRQQPTKAENHLRMARPTEGGMGAWQWDRRSGTLRFKSTLADLLKKGSLGGIGQQKNFLPRSNTMTAGDWCRPCVVRCMD